MRTYERRERIREWRPEMLGKNGVNVDGGRGHGAGLRLGYHVSCTLDIFLNDKYMVGCQEHSSIDIKLNF